MSVDTETKDVNANSSTEDIVTAADAAEQAKVAEKSAAKEQETEGQKDTTGKVEKTDQKVSDEDELDKDIKEGQAIPYDRFKKVNEERKQLKNRIKEFEESQGDDEELDAILKDPEIATLILTKQGFTKEAIAEKFKEAGIEVKQKDEKEPTFDLSTVEGWDKKIKYILNELLNQRLGPVEKTLTDVQKKEQMAQFNARMGKEAVEAEALAKEFDIEYGDEKDAKDPSTAVGKMMIYLAKHPEKKQAAAQGILSKSDLLRLAIGEEGVKLGEKKGEKAEKERQAKIRQAAMEGGAEITTDKAPDKNSSTEYIQAYHKKYPEWVP